MKNYNDEINIIGIVLENLVNDISNKINQLETKLKEVKSNPNKVQEIKKPVKIIEKQKRVDYLNTYVKKKSELKECF